jgi:uncharacterized protein YndB with AHSA1/START domain
MDLIAKATVLIRAPRSAVWCALMAPETIPQIMPVTKVVAPWRPNAPFSWTFTLAGLESTVSGRVQRVEDERLLEYDYADPHSRSVLGVDNVHRVSIELSDEAGATRVTVVQDANICEAARAHAEGGWRLALNNLARVVQRDP